MSNGPRLHTRKATAHRHLKDDDTQLHHHLYQPDIIVIVAADVVEAKIETFLDPEALLQEDDTLIPEAHHQDEEEDHMTIMIETGDVKDQFHLEMTEELVIQRDLQEDHLMMVAAHQQDPRLAHQ